MRWQEKDEDDDEEEEEKEGGVRGRRQMEDGKREVERQRSKRTQRYT
jgi:hypothetical protein